MKYVSIIIPTANDVNRLSLTLSSILFQNIDLKIIEVIIINKSSDDPILKLKNMFQSKINIKLFTQTGTWRANARNLGLKESTGDIILFIDDDLILCPDFIKNHIKHHMESDCVVVGEVRNIYISDLCRHFKALIDTPYNQQWFLNNQDWLVKKSRPHPYFSLTRIPYKMQKNKIPWIGFGTNNSSVRKIHLKDSNYFEESYQGWGLDNIEKGLRLYQKGLNFVYEPKAVNYHLSHTRNKESHLTEFQKNIKLFKHRNHGKHIDFYLDFIMGKLSIEEFNSRLSGQDYSISGRQHYYKDYQNLLKWIKLSK